MRRSGDGVTTRRSSGGGRSSSCSREIDWIADEHGELQRPSKRFKAKERKRTAECLSHGTGNSVKKNMWSQDEDDILVQMVGSHGKNKWSDIARSIPGRSREQCRERSCGSLIEGISPHQHVNTCLPPFSLFDLLLIKATRWLFQEKYCFRGLDILECRWVFYLDPAVNNQPWSEQEDITLIRAHHNLGNKWCKLAKLFPGRTGKAIKNRWNTLRNRKSDSVTINNKCSGTIKSGHDSCINIQVAVDCPIRPKPEQGFTEDGRNAALKRKGSDSTHNEWYVSVNVSDRQISRSSLPAVTKEKEVLPSSSVVEKVSSVAANFLEVPLKGVDAGFYPAPDHVDGICSSANPESPELHLANIAELLDMSHCESLMIVPPDSPNDGNIM